MDSEPVQVEAGPFAFVATLAVLPPAWRRGLLVAVVAAPLALTLGFGRAVIGPAALPSETELQARFCSTRVMACEHGGRVGVFAMDDYDQWRSDRLWDHEVASAEAEALRWRPSAWSAYVMAMAALVLGGRALYRGTAPVVLRRDGKGLHVGAFHVAPGDLEGAALAAGGRLAITTRGGARWTSPPLWVSLPDLATLAATLRDEPPERDLDDVTGEALRRAATSLARAARSPARANAARQVAEPDGG